MMAVTKRLFAVLGVIALVMMFAPSLAEGETPAPTTTPTPTLAPTDDGIGRAYCPVCSDVSRNYNMDRVYPNWGIQCQSLGDATAFGLDCTEDIQARFGAFCGCPGAVSGCPLCSDGGSVPNPNKTIPFALTTTNTCGDVELYASLRLETECQSYLDEYPFDTSGFCGCGGGSSNDNNNTQATTCSFCPPGLSVIDHTVTPPPGSVGNTTCEDIAEFAQYVTDPSYCGMKIKPYINECCF